jgi:hypothetical protein
MSKRFLIDAFLWGVGLWLFGYILGFIFFMLVPMEYIGWYITPIATAVTAFVIWRFIHGPSLNYYFGIGVLWAAIAVVLDYLFIVLLLAPADGYYKFDVFLYYSLTLFLPLIVCYIRAKVLKTCY